MPNSKVRSENAEARRILLVDDDRLILATLARSLRDEGYQVSTADSSDAALELCAGESFDLAILDMRMPDMSGSDLARQLREKHAVPILILSAYSGRDLVQQGVIEGALGYLVKPLQAAQVVPAIESALARAAELKSLSAKGQHLERALSGGRSISMAIGIVMERRGLSEKAAFAALRDHARAQQRRLEEVAQELVASLDRLNQIAGPESSVRRDEG